MSNRYQNGKIYKICDVGFNKTYIGSTCETLSKRMERHRKDYKEYCQGKERTYPTSVRILHEFGIENCRILLIENFACNSKEELLKREGEYMCSLECVNKNVAGRDGKQYYIDHQEHLKQKSKNYYNNNKEQCDAIRKQYYETHKDETKLYKQQWYKENKERHNEQTREYYKNNKEEQLLKNKQRYEQNKQKYNHAQRERYHQNKEQILEQQKVNVVCSCGTVLRKHHLRRHEKTRKHQQWLNQQQEQQLE